MSLKLYYDLLSQPSRALYIFFKSANIPFESVPVALRKVSDVSVVADLNIVGDAGLVVGNILRMSNVAIMRYLAREFNIADHWYPKDSKKQARVDEYLEWQHNNTRFHCAMFFQVKWLQPLMMGAPPSEKRVKDFEGRMIECLDDVENLWLNKSKFLTGDEISVADILGACEIEQPRMGDFDPCEGRPVLKAWLERVKSITNPHYDEAHSMLEKIVERNKTKAPWMAKSAAKL